MFKFYFSDPSDEDDMFGELRFNNKSQDVVVYEKQVTAKDVEESTSKAIEAFISDYPTDLKDRDVCEEASAPSWLSIYVGKAKK